MKKIIIFLLLISISPYVFAIQDVNIKISNTKGLCIYENDINWQYCDNETLTLSGTSDHFIHLSPQKPYGNRNNFTLDSNQTMRKYIWSGDYVFDFVVFGLFLMIFLSWVFSKRYGGNYRK